MAVMYLADAQQVTDATDLIATYGELAAIEASLRAGRSRDLGNHLHFCKWRQIERLIDVMSAIQAVGTVH